MATGKMWKSDRLRRRQLRAPVQWSFKRNKRGFFRSPEHGTGHQAAGPPAEGAVKWAATSFLVWGSVCGSGMLHPWLAVLLRSKLRVPKLSGLEDGGISTCTEIFGEPPLLAAQDSAVRPGRRSQLEKLSN